MRRDAGVGLLGLVVFIAGCPKMPNQPPSNRREALERVNDNLAAIHAPLQCAALVSFSFRDADGKMHRFIGHEARLIYQTPQSLLFDVRSLAGTVAQFGSNDDRFWLWIDVPDLRKLWWGSWKRVSIEGEKKLPVPPNELLDALMLRPLPESLEGGQLPLLRIEGEDCRLLFVRLGAGGQPLGWREIRLDPRPPFQPLEVVDRLPDGPIVMHAQLMDYRRVGSDGPYTPRRYVVVWPRNEAEMRLDILTCTFRPELPGDIFEFPTGWQGEREQIDAPAESRTSP
jgi:hypothetical protein